MFMNEMSFRGRFCAALAGAGLLLAQLATAGRPTPLVPREPPIPAPEYYIEWEKGGHPKPKPDHPDFYQIKGTLWHRAGNPPSPRTGKTSRYEPVRSAKIRYSYVIKGTDEQPLRKDWTKTGRHNYDAGQFVVTFTSPATESEIELTAAYYGASDKDDNERAPLNVPLAKATTELKKYLKLGFDGDVDPDLHPADLKGAYEKLNAKMIRWDGSTKSEIPDFELLEARNALLPPTNPDQLHFGTDIEVDQGTKSVKHTGDTAGVVAVQAVAQGLTSEPVWLAFGVRASLERIGEHKDEEIILQRPHGYNADYARRPATTDVGIGPELFMKEHAQLQLRLKSLLTEKALKGVPVTWSIHFTPKNMSVFLSKNTSVDSSSTPGATTDKNGTVSTPVSARHKDKDTFGEDRTIPPGETDGEGESLYKTATGDAKIQAEFKGNQVAQIDVPFIDSLWVIAKPTKTPRIQRGGIIDIEFDVLGYVGTDQQTPAQRKFEGFEMEEQSVVGTSRLGEGPIAFSITNDVRDDGQPVTPYNPEYKSTAYAGLALKEGSKGTKLIGKFKASENAGLHTYSLQQHWPVRIAPHPCWWGQTGATLKLPEDQLTINVVKKED
ncbi:MAG: hypothetical protein OXC07_03460 [Kistimonas sp.]|nr:hypothetical protein [Kistimonas sp.]